MKKLVLLIVTSLSAVAMENTKQLATVLAFSKDVVRSKESLGDIELFKHEDDFYVAKNGIAKPVHKYDVDSLLKKANPTQLDEYLKQGGYIQVDQLSNDDYVLKAKGRVNGGGPILAGAAYAIVKAVGYGVPAAVAIGTASTIAGPALATVGITGAVTKTALAGGTIALNTIIPATGTTGAILAGEAVVGAIGLDAAATATAAVMGSAGAGYIAGVETAAMTAFGWLLCVPGW